jgi:hypothetical protein
VASEEAELSELVNILFCKISFSSDTFRNLGPKYLNEIPGNVATTVLMTTVPKFHFQ